MLVYCQDVACSSSPRVCPIIPLLVGCSSASSRFRAQCNAMSHAWDSAARFCATRLARILQEPGNVWDAENRHLLHYGWHRLRIPEAAAWLAWLCLRYVCKQMHTYCYSWWAHCKSKAKRWANSEEQSESSLYIVFFYYMLHFFLLLLLLFYLHMTLRVAYSNGSVNSTSYKQHRAWACSIKGWNFSPSPYRRIASAYKWSVFSIPFAVNWVKNSKINATCEEKCKCGILDKQKWNNAFRSARCGIYHMQCYSHRIRLMDRGLWLYSEYIFFIAEINAQ